MPGYHYHKPKNWTLLRGQTFLVEYQGKVSNLDIQGKKGSGSAGLFVPIECKKIAIFKLEFVDWVFFPSASSGSSF